MSTTVGDLMTEPVMTVDSDDEPGAVARAMVEQGIHSVVVIDENCHPNGILTSTDYLRMTAEGTNPHAETVGSVMTTDIVTTTPQTPVAAAASLMADHDVGHLPVVGTDDQVIGILSATDLTEHLGASE